MDMAARSINIARSNSPVKTKETKKPKLECDVVQGAIPTASAKASNTTNPDEAISNRARTLD